MGEKKSKRGRSNRETSKDTRSRERRRRRHVTNELEKSSALLNGDSTEKVRLST